MPGRIVLIILLFVNGWFLSAQETEQMSILEQSSENILSQDEEEIDVSELKEQLSFFIQNPLDLNAAIESDFEKLGFLTCFKIAMIIEYRELHGPFLSTNELNGVDGLSTGDVQLLIPFVTVNNAGPTQKKNKILQKIDLIGGTEFPNSVGFNEESMGQKKFAGDPFYTRLKYSLHSNRIDAGISAEKDAGEKFGSYGFDFYSAFLEYRGNNILKKLNLGDYKACFGQGLVMWNGFSSGLNSSMQNIRKLRPGFSKFSSVNENLYLRGIATSIQWKFITFSPFLSSKNIDATQVLVNDSFKHVSSLKTSGVHALAPDIRDRKCLHEKSYGANLSFDYENYHLGFTSCNTNYSMPLIPELTAGTRYKFSGRGWNAQSVDYLLKERRFELFGEWAFSSNGGNAYLHGIQLQLISEMFLSALYRNFDSNYNSAYASSFAQNPKSLNEKGIFLGFDYSPISKIKLTGSADFYENPKATTRFNDSQQAKEYFIECTYFHTSETSFSSRYTFKNKKELIDISENGPKISSAQDFHKLRFQASFQLSDFILKNRLELCMLKSLVLKNQTGFLAYQELVWKPVYPKLSLFFRYTIFETDSWDTRMYTYENNMLNSFSFPAFSGKGIHLFIYSNYSFRKNLKLSLQYGHTRYFDRAGISFGPYFIYSNSVNELSCQLLLLF